MTVLDASALLAFAQGEVGADAVEAALEEGGVCGTANWSEVAQKIRAHGADWTMVRALFESYDLALEPVTAEDAERAAASWAPGSGLSLADRLCLALGERLGEVVLTADGAWGVGPGIRQIR
jgi:PIN domain nuclease of toxin-antitoxin system